MKTSVAPTSIAIYHEAETQSMMATQFDRVAAYVVEQTKAGKSVCITSIWEFFAKHEKTGLGQKGTVSRVCGAIEKAESVTVNGKQYRFERVASKKFNGKMVQHFCLVLVPVKQPADEGAQIEMNF